MGPDNRFERSQGWEEDGNGEEGKSDVYATDLSALIVMPQTFSPTSTRLLAFGGTVLVIAALYLSPTVPRFNCLPLNYLFATFLAVMLPVTLFVLMFAIRVLWLRWILGTTAVLISLPIVLFVLLALFQMSTGVTSGTDTSFERIKELQGEHGTYRLYRTNGGAMTSFGLVLRRERQILPGLRIVTVLRSYYPAADASLEFISSDRARLTVAPYGERIPGDTFEFST